jgi:hypothetical protein
MLEKKLKLITRDNVFEHKEFFIQVPLLLEYLYLRLLYHIFYVFYEKKLSFFIVFNEMKEVDYFIVDSFDIFVNVKMV